MSRRQYAENLAALPPAVQAALEPESAGEVPRVVVTDGVATLQTADGRRVPLHAADAAQASDHAVTRVLQRGDVPLLVVIGLGLGHLVDAFERRGASTRILAIEPLPQVVRAMLARRDWRAALTEGRLTLLVGPDYAGAADAWRLVTQPEVTPPTIASPVLERECPEATARAKALVAHIVAGARANAEARRRFAGRYLLNTLANTPVIAAEGDAGSLHGAFAGVPAVVVGAGPSLDDNLATLRALDGRALVIAVDTAVRPLLAAGVRPQLVVSVDPSDLNARHLYGLPDASGMWLAAEGSIDPSVLPQFDRRTFTFRVGAHHPWPWLASQGAGRGTLQAWGSVLTTAFDLANTAGCDPIVLAGADLAYTYGVLYCRNTVYEPEWAHFPSRDALAEALRAFIAGKPHLTATDVRGGEVLTAPHFVQFRDWLVSQSAAVAPRRVINITGAGILHGGRIEQGRVAAAAVADVARGVDRTDEWARRLSAAWHASRACPAFAAASSGAAARHYDAPLDEWVSFAGESATREDIVTALESALARLQPAATDVTSP